MSEQIVILNGSPKKEKGNTAFFLDFFKKGLFDSGKIIKEFYLYDIQCHKCLGCHRCWKEQKCVHGDETAALLNEIINSKLIVWATPLYFCTMTAKCKDLMERLTPFVQPVIKNDNRHKKTTMPDFALFSTCFYRNSDHFTPISLTFKEICFCLNINYVFELLIPSAPYIIDHKEDFGYLLDLVYKAGRSYGEKARIPENITSGIKENDIENNQLLNYHNRLYR
ncbi:MAG: flavodoxin family protein [Bacteroidales bacterium]|nr:flavodoxin family protein [Bacteroidales bacterium]